MPLTKPSGVPVYTLQGQTGFVNCQLETVLPRLVCMMHHMVSAAQQCKTDWRADAPPAAPMRCRPALSSVCSSIRVASAAAAAAAAAAATCRTAQQNRHKLLLQG
jgi:hypothetical protein